MNDLMRLQGIKGNIPMSENECYVLSFTNRIDCNVVNKITVEIVTETIKHDIREDIKLFDLLKLYE